MSTGYNVIVQSYVPPLPVNKKSTYEILMNFLNTFSMISKGREGTIDCKLYWFLMYYRHAHLFLVNEAESEPFPPTILIYRKGRG